MPRVLAEMDSTDVQVSIATALARRGGRRVRTRVPEDVWAVEQLRRTRELRQRRGELAARMASTDLAAREAATEQLMDMAFGEVSELKEQAEGLQLTILDREEENQALKEENEVLKGQAENWRKYYELASANQVSVGGSETLEALRCLPSTVGEAAVLAKELLSDRLVFTDDALQSAAGSSCDSPSLAWEMLRAAYDELWPLYFDPDELAPPMTFNSRSRFELAMTESELTKADKKLMKQRIVSWGGQAYEVSAHLKHGKAPPKLLRLHFAPIQDGERLLIGHLGDHLDTAGTRRRS